MTARVMWTRAEHGSERVDLLADGRVWARGQLFKTGDEALKCLVPATRLGFARYFRISAAVDDGDGLFDLPLPPPCAYAPPPASAKARAMAAGAGTRGVDLVRHRMDVVRILRSGFYGLIKAGHYEFDEVLQEVYKGILIRNAGRCPFDSSKSSLGHYLWMVCSCILRNYHRVQCNRTRHYADPLETKWEHDEEGAWNPSDGLGGEDAIVEMIDMAQETKMKRNSTRRTSR